MNLGLGLGLGSRNGVAETADAILLEDDTAMLAEDGQPIEEEA
jgi:hypothetical protein